MGKLQYYGQITEINSGVTYNSVSHACRELKINPQTIYSLLKKVDSSKPYIIEFEKYKFAKALNVATIEEAKDVQIEKGSTHSTKPLSVVDLCSRTRYESLTHCAYALGISRANLSNHIKENGFYKNDSKNFYIIPEDKATEELFDLYYKPEKEEDKIVEKEIQEVQKENISNKDVEFLVSKSGSVLILKDDEVIKKCSTAKDLFECIEIKNILV